MRRSPESPVGPDGAPGPDADSRRWLAELRASGAVQDAAVARLHALLLRAARFEVGRRLGTVPRPAGHEVDALARDAADDALMAVLAKLDTYRGLSRFTTWAYKFALLEAGVKLRRRAWHDREVTLDPDGWERLASRADGPSERAEEAELLRAVGRAIGRLTPHQRSVLIALAVDGVPIDVLAERLGTTRSALYKALHDARRRLRRELADDGLAVVGRGGEER